MDSAAGPVLYPRGSRTRIAVFKDPNNRALGPKYYNVHGIWALKPYDLGPWTLRDMHSRRESQLLQHDRDAMIPY